MSFGENVRWRRIALGISQAELARRMRREAPDRSQICRIESGQIDPKLSTVRAIARALHIKPWQLLAELHENPEFWRGYLDLSPIQKREIQHNIKWMLERRK